MRAVQKLQQSNPRINHGSAFAGKRVTGDDPLQRIASNPTVTTADFTFENHFSVCFLHPLTDAARAWVEDHIGADNGYQPQWPSVLLEPRYCGDVLAGIADAGLVVR
jgi:hypothetical protein